jgi:TonB dependent receptor-like, beta-barrel
MSLNATLRATLRHDKYDDVGAYTSPGAAAVWRIDDVNTLKLQYAKAFRPLTFYGLSYLRPGSIKAAEIATWELGPIRKRLSWEARSILFLSDLKGSILLDGLGPGLDQRLRAWSQRLRTLIFSPFAGGRGSGRGGRDPRLRSGPAFSEPGTGRARRYPLPALPAACGAPP